MNIFIMAKNTLNESKIDIIESVLSIFVIVYS